MRRNITAPQLNRALDQLQDFLELLPKFGKELFVTDDTIYVTMDPEEQECMQTIRHIGKNSIVVKYENITIKVIRMRNAVDGRYLYGFDDVFWKDRSYSVRIREKKIEEFLNRDKKYFPLTSR
ncbi:MAG: hypothetical protein ACLUCI_03355 [Blautia hansenii]|jgi:hypothetical protein